MRTCGKQVIQQSSASGTKFYVPDSVAEQASDRTADDVPLKVEVCPPRDGKRCTMVQDTYIMCSLLVFIGPPQKPVVAFIFAFGRAHGELALPFSFLKCLFAPSQQHIGVRQRAAQGNEVGDQPRKEVILSKFLP